MFCPKCGCEYEEGFGECADCHIPLVPEPPPPPPEPEYMECEPILSTYNAGDIAVIKAILESEGIAHFFEGEIFNMMRPFIQPARLFVRKDQVGQAKEILKNMKLEYFAISGGNKNSGEEDE